MRSAFFTVLALLSPLALAQFGAPPTPLQQAVLEALEGEIRTAEERARDRERQPAANFM